MQLWENNPNHTPVNQMDASVRVIQAEYNMIQQSNQCGQHMVTSYHDDLRKKLNCHIRVSEMRGDLHFSHAEMEAPAMVEGRYWLMMCGGKSDFTAKWPVPSVMQAVIDHFKGRIQFVQGGVASDHHPKLTGVIDMVGKTNIREMLNLIRLSSGVVTPISFAMHASAAMPMVNNAIRPCVVLAGGREPRSWEAYSGHAYLDRVGMLQCCESGACWKNKALVDGQPAQWDTCENVEAVDITGQKFPKCISTISAAEIIQHIERYLDPMYRVPNLIQIDAPKGKAKQLAAVVA